MKSYSFWTVLAILILAASLAALPYVGLPYDSLQATGLRLAVYEQPANQLFLPLVVTGGD